MRTDLVEIELDYIDNVEISIDQPKQTLLELICLRDESYELIP